MPTKLARLWVNHLSMTGDLSRHMAYLVNGHQLDPDEQQPKFWTKSLPKICKEDPAALVAHWRGIYDRFLTERATPDSMVRHNAKITGRQFVINLPNNITDDQVNKLVKGVLKDFPRHIPVSMVLHRTSNRGKTHTHLQGLFSYRNGGYGAIVDDFRLNITGQMKLTVRRELTNQGYFVDQGTPNGGINTKERRWLSAQGSVEQRRNPRFMMTLASTATSPRLQAYCAKQAETMSTRVGSASVSVDKTLQMMETMLELQSIPYQDSNSLREQSGTGQPRRPSEPLTQQALEQALIGARKWQHTKRNLKNIRF